MTPPCPMCSATARSICHTQQKRSGTDRKAYEREQRFCNADERYGIAGLDYTGNPLVKEVDMSREMPSFGLSRSKPKADNSC